MKNQPKQKDFFEQIPAWIGSFPSLILHTLFFAGIFILGFSGLVDGTYIFAITTNILSIEAIYLAIFIQMTVNRNTAQLKEVEEDIDEIQEDVEDLGEDIDEIQEDIEDIQEDVEEMSEEEEADEVRKKAQEVTLDALTNDVRRVLADLEAFKKGK
jgi:uncharacterized protein YoxC